VVEITLGEAKGKVPVLAGAGGYNTREVIELAETLERMGVDGILSVTPYYNKPTQEGLYRHYQAIASAVTLPIVVYSVMGRTGVNVEPATLARLALIPNIVGSEGGVGKYRAGGQHPARGSGKLHGAFGRRRRHDPADVAGRARRHLGGLQ
jgi:4-hydroxy-tetrahydrodipicolinate synthase